MLDCIFDKISDLVEEVSITGDNIFESIAKGITCVTNDSVGVVEGVDDEIARIFAFVDGKFILYVINAMIILYLLYRHIRKRQLRPVLLPLNRNDQPPLPPLRDIEPESLKKHKQTNDCMYIASDLVLHYILPTVCVRYTFVYLIRK